MATAFFRQNPISLVWEYGTFKADGITPDTEFTIKGDYGCRWETSDNVVLLMIIKPDGTHLEPFKNIPIGEVASDLIGTPYANRAAFETATKDFFFKVIGVGSDGFLHLPSDGGLIIDETPEVSISSIEIKTLDGIDTTKSIAEQFTEKTDNADFIEATSILYSKTEVDALLVQAHKGDLLHTIQQQGSDVLSLPAAATNLWYGSQAMVDGRAYQCTHIIQDTVTVTGVAWNMLTQGNYNADNYNGFFLCSVSGANYTVIASTENDATIWKKVATTYSKKAFTAPIVLVPGVYKLFGVYNTSDGSPAVVPAFYTGQGGGNSSQYAQMLTNGHKFEGYITSTTTSVPAAPFASSDVTAFAICPSFLLY